MKFPDHTFLTEVRILGDHKLYYDIFVIHLFAIFIILFPIGVYDSLIFEAAHSVHNIIQFIKTFMYKEAHRSHLTFNPPNAFWGLLGPRKDIMVNFTKTVSMQVPIFWVIFNNTMTNQKSLLFLVIGFEIDKLHLAAVKEIPILLVLMA